MLEQMKAMPRNPVARRKHRKICSVPSLQSRRESCRPIEYRHVFGGIGKGIYTLLWLLYINPAPAAGADQLPNSLTFLLNR
jgi:hypothetical protein